MDVAVEQVVADVGGRSLHALDVDFSFGHIKVVVEELTRVLGLPEEVLSNVAPELCGTGRAIRGRRISLHMNCTTITTTTTTTNSK